jgi:hypothetical protein
MNETKLKFMWWEDNSKLTSIELDCTIPLNIGDTMVHTYENVSYHLEVERRVFVPEVNILTIVFKPTS